MMMNLRYEQDQQASTSSVDQEMEGNSSDEQEEELTDTISDPPFDLEGMDRDSFLHLASLLDNNDRRNLSQTCQKFRSCILSRTTLPYDIRRPVSSMHATIDDKRASVATKFLSFTFYNKDYKESSLEHLCYPRPQPKPPRERKLLSVMDSSSTIDEMMTDVCTYWNIQSVLLDYYGVLGGKDGTFFDKVVTALMINLPEMDYICIMLRANSFPLLKGLLVNKWIQMFFRGECPKFDLTVMHDRTGDTHEVLFRIVKTVAEEEGWKIVNEVNEKPGIVYSLEKSGVRKRLKVY